MYLDIPAWEKQGEGIPKPLNESFYTVSFLL